MKHLILIPALAVMAACATAPVYGPAKSASGIGYQSQQIEQGRHLVTYTDNDPIRARNMALLRASEITLMEGRDWFEITRETADIEEKRSSGPSLSIVVARTAMAARPASAWGWGSAFRSAVVAAAPARQPTRWRS